MSETMVDSNNNSALGKYSLRPRSESKKLAEEFCGGESDLVASLQRTYEPKTRPRNTSRQRSQPLSKYRRRSANARERSRMREINEAFETLRRVVSWGSEKTTKISTLHLAMGYITALSEALRSPTSETAGDGGHQTGAVTEESRDERTSGRRRVECSKPPPLGFQNVSRMRLACSPNSFSSVDKSMVLKRDKVTFNTSEVSERDICENRTNAKHEAPSSSTDDGFFREVSLVLSDGYVSKTVSSAPITVDYCDNLQSPTETVESSGISQDCPFYPVKTLDFYAVETLDAAATSDFCKKSDQLSCETTLGFKSTVGKGSVLDTDQPVYEEDSSFLAVNEELGSLPMSHVSFEELFD